MFLISLLIGLTGSGYGQEIVTREEFYRFLETYIGNLQKANQVVDTSFSAKTNLDLRVRRWNDHVTNTLPRVFLIQVPLNKVSMKSQKYNRAYVDISYDFRIQVPEKSFLYENNLPEGNFKLLVSKSESDQEPWLKLNPEIKDLVIEANLARKYDVTDKKGYLLFGIKVGFTRASGMTQFYQTTLAFNSLKWMVAENLVWELEPLPFDQILIR